MQGKVCNTCKELKSFAEFNKMSKNKKDGHQYACKDCQTNFRKLNYEPDPVVRNNKRRKYRKSLQSKFNTLKYSSKFRNIEFDLSFEEYKALVKFDCAYCDKPLPTQGYGIDRVDSSLGYISGNLLPCCKKCNTIKGNSELPDLLAHIKQMAVMIQNIVDS